MTGAKARCHVEKDNTFKKTLDIFATLRLSFSTKSNEPLQDFHDLAHIQVSANSMIG